MKIFTALVFAAICLHATGSDVQEERKAVVCYYLRLMSEQHGTLYPEDIDATLCSHLMLLRGIFNDETEKIEIDDAAKTVHSAGFLPRIMRLKSVNPDLKLILLMNPPSGDWLSEPSRRKNMITNGVQYLNQSGIDGLEFLFFDELGYMAKLADFLCEMKPEFDKNGHTLSAILTGQLLSEPTSGKDSTINKVARCCNHVSVIPEPTIPPQETYRLLSLKDIESNVDWFVGRGLPAKKIKVGVPLYGVYVTLEDPNETGLGAKISGSGPRNEPDEFREPNAIRYKEVLKLLNDSSMGWTIRRDNETKEPYAFSATGLWTSYEDATSMSMKARYVMKKGLKGFGVMLDFDLKEDIGGEGRFPLTRSIYNTFTREQLSVDTVK